MSDEFLDHAGRPRVAITGLGVKAPPGNDVASFGTTVMEARSVAGPITHFDPTDIPIKFACEVTDYDPVQYFGPKEVRRADRVVHLAYGAAADAVRDAGELGADPSRCAVITGTGVGGIMTLEDQVGIAYDKGPMRVTPFFVPLMMSNAAAGFISMQLGWTGPNFSIASACASGTHALGESARLIRDGTSDVVMAGGCEASITKVTVAAFARMGALSSRNDEPQRASRPFDAERDGFVMGEGACFFVLEPLRLARARDAHVYAEIVGYGRNADAYHITAPSPGGAGAAACMQMALDDAGMKPADIGHVNAHGTSTPLNDAAEAEAIRKVFGDNAPPVTSTKGVTGHLIGAAGAVEAIAGLLAVEHGEAPPTANHQRAGDDIEADIVSGEPRTVGSKPVLSNSFGFGGHNATLI
ncbi:MAG: beta-ketoacyl-ACP synthase II, partial [Acidimicrobiia bacterium]